MLAVFWLTPAVRRAEEEIGKHACATMFSFSFAFELARWGGGGGQVENLLVFDRWGRQELGAKK